MHHSQKRNKSPIRPKILVPNKQIIQKANTEVDAPIKSKVTTVKQISSTSSKAATTTLSTPSHKAVTTTLLPLSTPSHKAATTAHITDIELKKFNPQEFIRYNATRNTYDICMIKKFIGKKILIPAKGLIITQKIKDDARIIKANLLTNDISNATTYKNIIIHVVCSNGTMYIINGYSNYLAISSIPYKDIETNNMLKSIEIKLVQLPKISNSEMKLLLDYFN